MNRNSIKTYHQLAESFHARFAPGIAADITRERIKREQAIEAKARQVKFKARMRQDTTPGDRVVKHVN